MTKETLQRAIWRIEAFYNLPRGVITKHNENGGKPKRIEGVNLSAIKQVIALYIKTSMRMTLTETAWFLGSRRHSTAISTVAFGVKNLEKNTESFRKYYDEIMTIISDVEKGEEIIRQRDIEREKEKLVRPPSNYSNTNYRLKYGI